MRRIVLLLVVLLLSSAVQAGGLLVAGDMVEVTGGALNLRDAPSVGQIVWTMPEGTQMEVIDGPVEQGGYTWWHLSGHEYSGWASDHRLKERLVERIVHTANDVAFHMRLAPAATFPIGIEGVPDDERDMRFEPLPGTATVDTPFWIGETEVTYELWYMVRQWALRNGYRFANAGMEGSTTGGGSSPNYNNIGNAPTSRRNEPVTMVSWRDSIVWCNALSQMLGYDPVYTYQGNVIKDSANATACDNAVQENTAGFRLPTMDEWELAARYIDGTSWTPGNYASGASNPAWHGGWGTGREGDVKATEAVAWYRANSGSNRQNVGLKRGNGLGLYDMTGNVWEWCSDWHPLSQGTGKVVRGGCSSTVDLCLLQVGIVFWRIPSDIEQILGFRLARTAL